LVENLDNLRISHFDNHRLQRRFPTVLIAKGVSYSYDESERQTIIESQLNVEIACMSNLIGVGSYSQN
jgi:hypothetical protein